MKNAAAYFEEGAAIEASSTLSRCFRAVQIVASLWTLAGCVIMMCILSSTTPSPKARVFGIGCILISAGIYSVLLPLWYIVKRSPLGSQL